MECDDSSGDFKALKAEIERLTVQLAASEERNAGFVRKFLTTEDRVHLWE